MSVFSQGTFWCSGHSVASFYCNIIYINQKVKLSLFDGILHTKILSVFIMVNLSTLWHHISN